MNLRKQYLLATCAVLASILAIKTARASGYSYAEITLTNLHVTTTVANPTVTGTASSASATVNGAGIATNAPADTLQAYVGAAPPAPQNSYVKYSTFGGGPQAGDFVRGDSVINSGGSLFSTGVNTSALAEAFNSAANTLSSGASRWSLSATFNSTAASITLAYNFATDIIASVIGGVSAATAQASFAVMFSIKDQHGHEVDVNPLDLNSSLLAPPNGPEFITSGSGSTTMSLAGLTAGDTYTLDIVGTTSAISNNPAAPVAAPEGGSSLLMLGISGLSLLGVRKRVARG